MLFLLAPVALLSLLLVGMGILGRVEPRTRNTDYRSAVGAQQPRRIVLPDGVKIAYADSGGDGPILICLHAIGHGARDFEDLTRRLSPQYRVIALDFPGQGNSGADSEPASATRYAQLLSEFIDQLGLKSVVLIGNSIGGAASMRYASAHPERVRALVLCDTGGLGQPGLIGRVFIGAFVQFFAAGRRGAFWFPWAFSKYYQHVLIMESARIERDRISRSAYEIASPLEQAWKSFGTSEENLLPILPRIQCPVLLAWAKQDFVLPLKNAESSFRLFRSHQLETFEGGHAAFLEDSDRFELALRRFLKCIVPLDHHAALPNQSSYQQRTTQKDNPTQQLIKQAVDFLLQQLAAGKSETLTAYLAAMARFHSYSFGNILAIARQRAVTYCYTSLESMNIGGCASLETRDGRHGAVRTNLMDLVDRKQITHD